MFIFFFFFCGGGVFKEATAYTPEWVFTQKTSKDVVLSKYMRFGGLDNYI